MSPGFGHLRFTLSPSLFQTREARGYHTSLTPPFSTEGQPALGPVYWAGAVSFLVCPCRGASGNVTSGCWVALLPGSSEAVSLQALQSGGHGYLEGLDEGPQQGPDAFPSAQQLHQAHDPEEAEEGDGDAGVLLCTLEPVGNRGCS